MDSSRSLWKSEKLGTIVDLAIIRSNNSNPHSAPDTQARVEFPPCRLASGSAAVANFPKAAPPDCEWPGCPQAGGLASNAADSATPPPAIGDAEATPRRVASGQTAARGPPNSAAIWLTFAIPEGARQ